MDRSKLLNGGLVLGAMVLIPGVSLYVLTQLGYAGITVLQYGEFSLALGSIVWYGGYGLGVVLVWAMWLRPLDITGPADPGHPGE